jgi:hypothetical protein
MPTLLQPITNGKKMEKTRRDNLTSGGRRTTTDRRRRRKKSYVGQSSRRPLFV